MYPRLLLPFGSGLVESAAQLAVIAGSIVLVLMLVAFGGFAYKSLRGDGIRWPDETDEQTADNGVQKGGDEDDWKYY